MSVYDTARQLKIPGVVVQAHIDPTLVSPRIKKMAQTMLRKGMLKGGWNSKSALLARHLLEDTGLPVLARWNSFYRAPKFNAETLAYFDELFEADIALQKMDMSPEQLGTPWNAKVLRDDLEENQQAVRRVGTTTKSLFLRMYNEDLRAQAHEKLLALRSPKDVAALDALAARLDDPTPIPVKLKN